MLPDAKFHKNLPIIRTGKKYFRKRKGKRRLLWVFLLVLNTCDDSAIHQMSWKGFPYVEKIMVLVGNWRAEADDNGSMLLTDYNENSSCLTNVVPAKSTTIDLVST